MPRIDIWFLLLATLCLAVGVSMGIVMGITQDFSLAPVHVHVNLVGWASLALFGLTYRAWPELHVGGWARAHFFLTAPTALLFPLGIYIVMRYQHPLLAIITSLLWLSGVLVFLGKLVCLARAPRATLAEKMLAG